MAVPAVDFSPLGDLYNTYRQARTKATRDQALSQLGQGAGPLDYTTTARALLAAGDTEGGLTLARLAETASRDARDFAFREQESRRAQGNTDRAFTLQKEQADAAARGFDYREVDDGMGGKKLVRIEKATGAVSAPPIAGVQDTPNNPFAQGKMTDEQSKAGLYSSRMMNAESILRDPASVQAATSLQQQGLSRIPIAGNFLVNESFQKYDQAQRDFINAVLRRESGAVISDAEFDNARKQYFPQPGDTAERIKQKQANRAEAIRGIAAGAGPGYRPDRIFDAQGDIIDNPAPKRGEQKAAAKPIADKAAYDALPPGTPYIAPDGSQRIKR